MAAIGEQSKIWRYSFMRKRLQTCIMALCVASLANAQPAQDNAPSSSPGESVVMAKLSDDDMAVSLNGEAVTWGELREMLPDEVKVSLSDGEAGVENTVLSYLRQMLLRGCLKQDAVRQGYSITPEERGRFIQKLKKDLEVSGKGVTVEEYLKNFDRQDTMSWCRMSVNELMMVARLAEDVSKEVEVSEEDVRRQYEELNRMNEAAERKNDELRRDFDFITNDVRMETDDGFKAIARDYSDGAEAVRGGVVSAKFTRAELAEELGMESFDLAKGQNTGMIETPTAIRIVRVMDVIAPSGEGGVEQLKVAQILFRKEEVLKDVPEAIVRNAILENKRNQEFNKYADRLFRNSRIQCPLFPEAAFGKK